MTPAPVRFDRSPKRGDRTGPVPDVVPTGPKTTQDHSRPVIRPDVDADLREAIEQRLAERIERARRRRAQRQAAQDAKDERRRHGLAARHRNKLHRQEDPR